MPSDTLVLAHALERGRMATEPVITPECLAEARVLAAYIEMSEAASPEGAAYAAASFLADYHGYNRFATADCYGRFIALVEDYLDRCRRA